MWSFAWFFESFPCRHGILFVLDGLPGLKGGKLAPSLGSWNFLVLSWQTTTVFFDGGRKHPARPALSSKAPLCPLGKLPRTKPLEAGFLSLLDGKELHCIFPPVALRVLELLRWDFWGLGSPSLGCFGSQTMVLRVAVCKDEVTAKS